MNHMPSVTEGGGLSGKFIWCRPNPVEKNNHHVLVHDSCNHVWVHVFNKRVVMLTMFGYMYLLVPQPARIRH